MIDASKEYIPIPVVNGYGEVTISSNPVRNTYLQLNEAGGDRIFTCTSDYLEIVDISVQDGESIIRLANTQRNANSAASAIKVEIQGNTFEIVDIDYSDSDIYVRIGSVVQYDKNLGNYIKME